MKLKYVNAAAKTQDIQVPGVQVEPLEHLHVYDVDKKLGLALLESDGKHWKEVLPKEESVKVKTKARTVKADEEEYNDNYSHGFPESDKDGN